VKRTALLFLNVVLLAAVFLALPFAQGRAQAPSTGVTMQVEAAYDGIFKNGEWLPIWVTLENSGPDREARLQARITSGSTATNYAVPVPLPTGSRKRVPLYVLPNSFSRELEIELVSAEERLAVATVQVQPQMNIAYVVGLLAPERGATALISGVKLPGQFRPIVLVDLSVEDLPERPEGLRTFDTLLVNDFDTTTLSQEQRLAIEAWVQAGGRLVLGGGPGASRTTSGLSADLLPVQVNGLEQIDALPALAAFAGTEAVRVPGPFSVATGQITSGKVLVDEAGMPLLVESDFGSGVVNFVALDLSAAPFDAWSGTTPFWQTLLSPGAAYPNWLAPDIPQRQMMADQMNYALSSLPALDLPSVQGLAIMLFVYVMLVGPINYIVLRRMNRLQWAWVTIPALTVIFSLGTFGLGFALRGNDIIMNKIALVQLQPDGSGQALTFFGLFSPAQSAYEVEVPDTSLLSGMQTYYDPWSGAPNTASQLTFVQSEPAIVEGLAVNQWSMQAFQSESVWTDFGNLNAELFVDQEGLHGEIRNNSGHTLRNVNLVMGARHQDLGDIPPGEARPVALAIPEETGFRYSGEIGWLLFEDQFSGSIQPPRDLEVKRTMVNAIFQYGGATGQSKIGSPAAGTSTLSQRPVLLAWLDSFPPEVLVNDREVQEIATALIYQPMTYELAAGDQVWLPVGMIPGGLVEYPVEGGNCGPDNTSVWLGRGEAVFAYQLPETVRTVTPETLRLSIRSDGGWFELPTVSMFDWSTSDWVTLEGAATGVNVVGGAGRFIDSAGNIRVQLATEVNTGGGCLFVELGMQGTRQ
jgi:hypothetical protein